MLTVLRVVTCGQTDEQTDIHEAQIIWGMCRRLRVLTGIQIKRKLLQWCIWIIYSTQISLFFSIIPKCNNASVPACHFQNNEKVEMDIYEYVQMQEPNFHRDWKMFQCGQGLSWKIMTVQWNKWATFKVVRNSPIFIFVTRKTLHDEQVCMCVFPSWTTTRQICWVHWINPPDGSTLQFLLLSF